MATTTPPGEQLDHPEGKPEGATSDPARRGPVILLGSTITGDPLPRVRRRFTPLHYRRNPFWGWVAPIVVTLCTGILLLWHLSTPPHLTFDETYYAKDSYSLLIKHFASNFVNNPDTSKNEADAIINSGSTKGIFSPGASMVVHPEVGKWMIAVGEWLFGLTPFGWRFSSAVTGTLMVLVLSRLLRRMTGSTLLGCVGGALLALDGLHFVMSRLALLDIFLAFWLLCAVHCLVADRDWARAKMSRRYEISSTGSVGRFGPVRGFLLRPWRIAGGVCFGLACGTKWSGLFVLLAFGLLIWAWDSGMRRAIGVRWAWLKSLLVDAIPSVFSVLLVAFVVYVVSWLGFLTHAQKFEDAFGNNAGSTWSSVGDFGGHPHGWLEKTLHALNILWNYHKAVYAFHTGTYIQEATHPFQSNPGGWLLINRPLGVAALYGDSSVVPACPKGEQCVQQILAIGTPLLWWGGVIALILGLAYWLSRRDWRFGVPLVGVLTTWLPWFRYDQRPIFFYYGVAIIPFTVIAVTLVLGKMLGKPGASYRRRVVGVTGVAAFVAAVALNFVYFYPILSNGLLTNEDWNDRMWLTHWM